MLRVAEEFHGTHTGQQRRANEDSLYARSPLFAVADGMGGAQAGEIASRIAVETLGGGVPEGEGQPVEQRLAGLVREANERIHELSRSDDRRAGMGTTMTAVLVGEDEVTIAHVGDSRAYLLRDGELHRLTRDHSLVEELVQQGKLTPEEAHTHPQRSVITRAVGPEARVEVDTQTSRARDGDVVLICSDGLTTMVGEDEIGRTIAAASSLDAAGHALIDAANAAGGRDNITVVLFRLAEVGRAEPAAARAVDAQETGVHEAVRAPAAPAVSTLERERAEPGTTTKRLQPIAPAEPAGRRRSPGRRRLRRVFTILAVVAVIGVPIAFGVMLAVRSVYFIGEGQDGFVTVYRGLPYDLPLGIELYQQNYVSPITLDQVPRGRRASLVDQQMRSQDDAYDLVRRLELGQVNAAR